jgi:hypothetical protein
MPHRCRGALSAAASAMGKLLADSGAVIFGQEAEIGCREKEVCVVSRMYAGKKNAKHFLTQS